MKTILFSVIVLWHLLLAANADDNRPPNIQVVSNYFEGDVYNYPTNVVKLRIVNSTLNDIHSETVLILSNTSKTAVDKPIILQNSDRTIIGFEASVARASYKIILVYISNNGEAVINQNFNLEVANVLRRSSPGTKFDADGFYIDHIDGRNLRIGFQSDSGKGSFKFRVRLTPDGHLQMIPSSIVSDNYRVRYQF